MALPSARSNNDISGGETRMVGRDDFAHGFAGHHFTDLDRDSVGLFFAQTSPHIRIDRQPDRPCHHLPWAGRRNGIFAHVEIRGAEFAARAPLQDDRTAGL